MTTSYVTGTVSVAAGSDMVTGSGTGWLSANVAPGFLGLDSDNGNPVPVAEILSDTSLRLVTPWRGTSASGQSYWLSYDTRDGQQTVNNAQRLAEYIARLNNTFFNAIGGLTPSANTFLTFDASATAVLSSLTTAGRALLGVTGAADVIPYFTSATAVATTPFGAAARSLLGLAASENSIPYMDGPQSYAKTAITELGRSIIGALNGAAVYGAIGEIPDTQIPSRIRSVSTFAQATNALDLISESGWVHVPTTGNVATVNGPSGAPAGLCLTIIGNNSQTAIQVYYGVSGSGNRSWTRRKQSNAWEPWQLTDLPIVGTVSQVSGVPFGAIMERGSNANGEYVRFADGTQICWSPVIASGAINLAFGNVFANADNQTWTFPVAFASGSRPSVSGSCDRTATPGAPWLSGAAANTQTSATSTLFRVLSAFSGTQGNTMLTAIGRWF